MVTLTQKAAAKVASLAKTQGKPEAILRVKVGSGGCSGMSYSFELTDAVKSDDVVFAGYGAKAVVDPRSDFFIGGSEIDYFETLMEAKFKIQNPQAKSTCSCGTSFST